MILLLFVLLPLIVVVTIDDIRAGNKMQRRNKRIKLRRKQGCKYVSDVHSQGQS